MSELTKTYKMKVVQLHEWTKNSVEHHIEPKKSPLGPQKKSKMTPKLSQTQMQELTET